MEIEEYDKQKILSDRFEEFKARILSDARYFHINSVSNLILSFDEIENQNDKNWIFDNLNNYINRCNENIYDINRETGHELYEEYLDKLFDYVSKNLGFILFVNRTVTSLFYMLLFLALYFIFNFYIGLIAIFLFCFHSFKIYQKYKKHKLYAIFY